MSLNNSIPELVEIYKKTKQDRKFLRSTVRKRLQSYGVAVDILNEINNIFDHFNVPFIFGFDEGEPVFFSVGRPLEAGQVEGAIVWQEPAAGEGRRSKRNRHLRRRKAVKKFFDARKIYF